MSHLNSPSWILTFFLIHHRHKKKIFLFAFTTVFYKLEYYCLSGTRCNQMSSDATSFSNSCLYSGIKYPIFFHYFSFFPTSNPQSGKFSMLNPLLAQSIVPGTVCQSCTVGLRLELQSSDNSSASCSTWDLISSRTEILPEQLNTMSWNMDAVGKKFIVNGFRPTLIEEWENTSK